MAVSNPLRYRVALVESTPTTRAFKYIVPAVLCSFALNIPKFLEVEVRKGGKGGKMKYVKFRPNLCLSRLLAKIVKYVNIFPEISPYHQIR